MLKLPVLVEHFKEHKAIEPEMTFVEFMTLHYNGDHLEDHPEDDDYDQDQKLPFMRHTNVLSVYCAGAPSFVFDWKNKIPKINRLNQKVYDDMFKESAFLSAIWQPPKSC